jgi:hypothetical protein
MGLGRVSPRGGGSKSACLCFSKRPYFSRNSHGLKPVGTKSRGLDCRDGSESKIWVLAGILDRIFFV